MTALAAAEVGITEAQGLWRRAWLRAPGVEDATTTVLWRQGGLLYVDLRVPAAMAPLAGCAALADLSADELRGLAACEGFAGEVALSGGVCTWTRRINWRGPETGADVGRLELTAEGLVETGVQADYAELWLHAPDGPTRGLALDGPDGARGYLVWSDGAFSFGRGAPGALTGPPLADRIEAALAAGDRAALAAAFDMEFSSGVFVDGAARMVVSTDPSRVGAVAFDRAALEARDDAARDGAALDGAAPVEIALTGFDGRARRTHWTPRPS
jgi:hypothetical protein